MLAAAIAIDQVQQYFLGDPLARCGVLRSNYYALLLKGVPVWCGGVGAAIRTVLSIKYQLTEAALFFPISSQSPHLHFCCCNVDGEKGLNFFLVDPIKKTEP